MTWVDKHEYLGICIRNDFSDEDDIQRQIKALYTRGNMLVRKFYKCSTEVKVRLFKTYIMNFYGATIWSDFSNDKLKKLQVAYNNVFRAFLGVERRGTSASFMDHNTDSFKMLLRKMTFRYKERILNCENSLISKISLSTFFCYTRQVVVHME